MSSSREEIIDAAIEISDAASAGDALAALTENNANPDILQVAAAVNMILPRFEAHMTKRLFVPQTLLG